MRAQSPRFSTGRAPQGLDLADALRSALLAALVTALLCIPVVVLHADRNLANRFVLEQRWWWMAVAAGAVFVARFLALALRALLDHPAPPAPATRPVHAELRTVGRGLGVAAWVGVCAYPILLVLVLGPDASLKWINNYGIQILIYVMLGWGLNIVVGLAGLLDLGYVAFYAVGAYAYALLSTTLGLSFWACLPLAGLAAAGFGLVLGFPVLRLRGDYLAIVTLAFGEIIYLVLINWTDFTNGDAGILDIPAATFFGIPFTDADDGFAAVVRGLLGRWFPEYQPIQLNIFLFYLALAMALVTYVVTARLRRLPMGRAWEALREDEIACRSLGIDTVTTKLSAFALGASFAGLAGAFFAVRQGYVNPSSFKFDESALILAIVVLGGMGSQAGVAIAAVVMIGGTELLRELDWTKQILGDSFDPTQYRMLLFGLGMVAMMVWRPRGLVSTRRPTIVLRQEKLIDASLVAEGRG